MQTPVRLFFFPFFSREFPQPIQSILVLLSLYGIIQCISSFVCRRFKNKNRACIVLVYKQVFAPSNQPYTKEKPRTIPQQHSTILGPMA